jgi:AMMECR1 domain-containing protein
MHVYTTEEKQILLKVAHLSIETGLSEGRSLSVNVLDYTDKLQQQRASFITIEKNGSLRGCIGSLQAHRSLVLDIAENAFAAAFRDPRFV